MSRLTTAIIGATGYTGGELLRLLSDHARPRRPLKPASCHPGKHRPALRPVWMMNGLSSRNLFTIF